MRYAYSHEVQPQFDLAESLLNEGKITDAAKIYSEILSNKKYKFQPFALAGLAQCALKEGNVEVANELVQQIKSDYEETLSLPKIKQVVSAIELESSTPQSQADLQELINKLQQNPKDLETQYALAMKYQSAKRYEDAINELFKIIKIDREWNNQAAKQTLIKLFDSLGPDHELTNKGRKRLNNVWFS